MQTVDVMPLYSFILVSDGGIVDVPRSLDGKLVAATKNCVVVGCRSADDGPTRFVLARANSYSSAGSLVFSGCLKTTSKKIVVSCFPNTPILTHLVDNVETEVQIFSNDPVEPDTVEILFN